jgi:hypothetical protein
VDWVTASSLATAGGTLVLAVATFSSVRSANRAGRVAERAFQVGLRPVLFPSRPGDPTQKLMWMDNHWESLPGGGAVFVESGDVIYLAISLRNVGQGIAVLRGWNVQPRYGPAAAHAPDQPRGSTMERPEVDSFRRQTRDLYVACGDTAFWQAAIRGRDDPQFAGLSAALSAHASITVDLLYGDHEGGQRAISRFAVTGGPGDDRTWLTSVVYHWNLDRVDPR